MAWRVYLFIVPNPYEVGGFKEHIRQYNPLMRKKTRQINLPASRAANGPALGTQAGESKIGEVMKAGGFRHFRRTTQTPFNQIPVLTVYEARR